MRTFIKISYRNTFNIGSIPYPTFYVYRSTCFIKMAYLKIIWVIVMYSKPLDKIVSNWNKGIFTFTNERYDDFKIPESLHTNLWREESGNDAKGEGAYHWSEEAKKRRGKLMTEYKIEKTYLYQNQKERKKIINILLEKWKLAIVS